MEATREDSRGPRSIEARPVNRRRRMLWIAALGLVASAVLYLLALGLARTTTDGDAQRAEATAAYAAFCEELLDEARTAAEEVARLEAADAPPLAIFEHLGRRVEETSLRGLTLIHLDADGQAVAWAGDGLLHEPEPSDLGDIGRLAPELGFQKGYSAVTLYAVAPLGEEGRRPKRLLAGRSFATRGLPFLTSTRGAENVIWSLAAETAGEGTAGDGTTGDDTARENVQVLRVEGAPSLWLERRDPLGEPGADEGFGPRWRPVDVKRLAALLFGLTFFGLAGLIGPVAPETKKRPVAAAVLAGVGVAIWGAAAGLWSTLHLGLIGAVILAVWSLSRPPSGRPSRGGELLGGLAVLLLPVLAWSFQDADSNDRLVPRDLAAELGADTEGVALRLTLGLMALGLLSLSSRRVMAAGGDRSAWGAVLFLLGAAAVHDRPFVALPLLALAGAAATHWLAGLDLGRRPTATGAVLLLVALTGAVSWEIAYRESFRDRLEEVYLPRVAPPEKAEIEALSRELEEFFAFVDLHRSAPPGLHSGTEQEPDPQDLAFVLWRESPLSRRDGASALLVELEGAPPSSFSFGLPLGRDLEIVTDVSRWPVPAVGSWRQASVGGEAELFYGDERRGRLRYWFLPRPGFRLPVDEIAELEAALLRGGPRGRLIDGLPRPALFALYDTEGRAVESPWDEAPPMSPAALEAGRGVVDTPAGSAFFWASSTGEVVEVLYLPRLAARLGLERVGTHALGSFIVLALLSLGLFLVALPQDIGVRGLVDRVVRSYSLRLLVVYTSLLLIPLVTLNFVLLHGFEERLRREQQEQGEAALVSARRYLLDYIKSLPPGFGIDTEVHRELLEWVSSLARHQVNFYWRSELYASSQQELFTAGLLPKRIPGDVFSRLALLGHKVGRRTQHTGELDYGEVYAPLSIGGSGQGLFLSVPLLEQEEGVARELATLRRRALLATSALFFLLLAVGGRLAASFTKPIMELIEGTREIAAGATFLAVAPRERELEALADAIDEMARRIAEGRHQLVLEKEVVERMVEHITSGVVSLDHAGRVLLRNRVAAELLGAEVGISIDRFLEADDRLHPVTEFVAEAVGDAAASGRGGEIRQTTVQLADATGEVKEWSLTWVPIPGPEDPAALLVVDDDTEVLRGQRLEAWAEMARLIAHEIKNPLTPIRLSAEHLRQVYARDPERLDEVFDRCTLNILKEVEELRDIATDFSIYSRIPRAELREGDLVAAMRELIEAYHDTSPGGVEVRFASPVEELSLRFDEKLLGRAVRNLLENALRASAATAARREAEGRASGVELAVEVAAGRVRITVADTGPGVAAENLPRIFEPYFSTHESGTGLGLAIAQRIVEEHGGRLEAQNPPGGGLAVTITIPLSDITAEGLPTEPLGPGERGAEG